MVTVLPYECMPVNPQRPGLEYSGYARVYFAHSVVVSGYIAMDALFARMSPGSGMMSNARGQEGWSVNPCSNA
jgi:hypothetical protein